MLGLGEQWKVFIQLSTTAVCVCALPYTICIVCTLHRTLQALLAQYYTHCSAMISQTG